ncbi:uncharacterized protein [Antedon mediterranea]|uniref:uncharacterized protein n=1 Tax=Antedon mediterranea TaxID=105859 RepID=UPI003AF425F7
MVLTRQQRKSGITVTPPSFKKTENRKKDEIKTHLSSLSEQNCRPKINLADEKDSKKKTGFTDERMETAETEIRPTSRKQKVSPQKNIIEDDESSSEDDIQRTELHSDFTDSRLEKPKIYSEQSEDIQVNDNLESSDDGESMASEENDAQVKVQQLEESDDEAPESMSFNVARETALETLHQAYKESLKVKSKKKEKRRAHDTMMKDQAKKKIKRCEQLESKRLPDTFLQQVDTENSNSEKPTDYESDEIGEDDDEFSNCDEDEENEDYVVEKEGFQIVPLQKIAKMPVVKSMEAFEFRQEQLYGKRIPRVSASAHISMTLKKSSKPAIGFKVKGLAVTKKERRQKRNNWSNLIT